MGIQTTDGPIVVDLDDVQFFHRGEKVAIKIRVLGGVPYILGVRLADRVWQTDVLLDDETFTNTGITPESEVAKYGSAKEWVRRIVLPRLQDWLDRLFPPEGNPVTALQQIHLAIKGFEFVFEPDGTVTVALP